MDEMNDSKKVAILESKFQSLNTTIHKMTTQQAVTEGVLSKILVRIENHLEEERRYDKTLTNVDDNVRKLTIDMAKQQAIRTREMREVVDPIWQTVRTNESKFLEFKTESNRASTALAADVKKEIRAEAHSHLVLFWVMSGLIGILFAYVIHQFDERNNVHMTEYKNHINRSVQNAHPVMHQTN